MRNHVGFVGALALAGALLGSGFAPAAAADRMEFELPTLNGGNFIKLDDFAGRPVLINVWGTECPPCIIETPLLSAQSQIYKNVQFLGVGTDERMASLIFVNRHHVQYPQLQAPTNPSGLLRRLGDLDGALPFTVVLDTRHRICASRRGAVDADWIGNAVRKCEAD
ncbi:MAG TPA: TlpA disulfide reductase family protein [Caulobacteraceae bacterium]|nr:TlpA disulfide reductase family protein [Caulobacteraceae bacterium]